MGFSEMNQEMLKQSLAMWANVKGQCKYCIHKDVCKNYSENGNNCDNYKKELSYKVYVDINELFQPIFKWIDYHYPAGGVVFYVENGTAKMRIDHGPFVMDDKYNNYAVQNPTFAKENNDK